MDTPQEISRLRDYILFLEGEVAQLTAEKADLQDQLDAMNEPKYD